MAGISSRLMSSSMSPANAGRKIKLLKDEIRSLTSSLQYYQSRCELLERIIIQINPCLLPNRKVSAQNILLSSTPAIPNPQSAREPTLQEPPNQFLDELCYNQSRKPQGRHWSREMKRLCFVVRSLGSKVVLCKGRQLNGATCPPRPAPGRLPLK